MRKALGIDKGCVEALFYVQTSIYIMTTRTGKDSDKGLNSIWSLQNLSICQGADETLDHTFFGCPVSKALWGRTRAWLGIRQEMGTSKRMLKIFHGKYKGNSSLTKGHHLAMSCIIHLLWQARNRCQYEGESPNIKRMFVKIQTHAFHFICAKYVYPHLTYNAFTIL